MDVRCRRAGSGPAAPAWRPAPGRSSARARGGGAPRRRARPSGGHGRRRRRAASPGRPAGRRPRARPGPSAPAPSGCAGAAPRGRWRRASASGIGPTRVVRRGGDELGEPGVAADARRHEREDDRVRATSSSSANPSRRVRPIASNASEAPVTVAAAADGISRPDERLVAVQADERAPAVAEHGEQLLVGQSCGAGTRRRGRRRPGRRGRWRAPAARRGGGRRAMRRAGGAPAGAGRSGAAGRGGARRRRAGRDRRRRGRRRRHEVAARGPSAPGDVPVSSSASRSPSRNGSSHRSCSSVASGSGNVSATGPGPNTVPAVGGRVVIGRACSRCRAPVASTAHSTSWGPPNARPASWPSRASRRSTAAGGRGASPTERTSTTRPRRSRTPVQPSVAPDTSWSGPPATAATTMRSWRPVSGSAPNSTPPHTAVEHRLHEHGHLGVDEPDLAGPFGRAVHLVDGEQERGLAGHVEDRLEHAGHRRRVAVLAGRRRAHDDRHAPVVGDGAPRGHGVVVGLRSPGRREDGAGQGRQPGGARASARLAAFAPTSVASVARGSESGTTVGRGAASTRDQLAPRA